MTSAGTVYVDLRARLDQFQRDLRKAGAMANTRGGVAGAMAAQNQQVVSRWRSTLGTMGATAKRMAPGVGAALGTAIAGGAAVGIKELMDAEKVMAQTEARLESTGGAANITAGEVVNLAGRMSELSGVDDEAIQAGENLLLTFTKIRNEAGKGNDIFDQATKAALDLSVALETDITSASLQLGKALNDPVRGLTALGRAGVQFTDEQKAVVARLVETGHVAEAQKVILTEVFTQVGGSAAKQGKTTAGNINRIKNSFSELAGTLSENLKPAMKTAADGLQAYANLATEAFQQDERRNESHKSSVQLMAQLAEGVEAGTVTQERYLMTVKNLADAEGQSAAEKARLRAVSTVLTRALAEGVPVAEALERAFGAMGREIAETAADTRGLTRDLKNVPKTITTEFVTVQTVRQQVQRTGSGKLPLGVGVKPRADGGAVAARHTYLVGERGPELFKSSVSGAVIPNHKMGGITLQVFVKNNYGADDLAKTVQSALRRHNVRVGA